MDLLEKSAKVKEIAQKVGFAACGIASARYLDNDARQLQQWLEKGYAAEMAYMHQHFEKRTNPSLLLEGTQSVIVVLDNYTPESYHFENSEMKISRYALGRDYHKVVKAKLKRMYNEINATAFKMQGRWFTDSAPILEKAWAREAGLGWIGKNSLLLNKKLGSYVFIGIILTDTELVADKPLKSLCGNCSICIDACPTQAIVSPGIVDSRKCISFHTIESKTDIPSEIQKNLNGWIFGCDICQQECPWTIKALPHNEPSYNISPSLATMDSNSWQNLSEKEFEEIAIGSAIKRAGFSGLKRNIQGVGV